MPGCGRDEWEERSGKEVDEEEEEEERVKENLVYFVSQNKQKKRIEQNQKRQESYDDSEDEWANGDEKENQEIIDQREYQWKSSMVQLM